MPIDTSIYSQIKPIQIENPLEAQARVDQYRAGQMQNRLAELAFGQKQREIEQENALAGLYRESVDPNGQLNRQKLLTGAAQQGLGNKIPGIQKTFSEQDKAIREAEKERLAAAKQQIELIGQVAGAAKDPESYAQGRAFLQKSGIDVNGIPEQYDPQYVAQARAQAMSAAQQLEQAWKQKGYDLDVAKLDYQQKNDAQNRQVTIRGQNLTDARGREANQIKQQEVAMGGKPPPGYRWKGDVLEAIPGGPGDKLPEAQQKQVVGTQNLSNAIAEYRKELAGFGGWSKLNPDQRAKMGTKYNNMMLQAKEAYNLGVLNGPDLEIMTNVITDPRSPRALIISKEALDTQAAELDRMMGGVAQVSSQARPKPKQPSAPANTSVPKAGTVEGGYRFKGGNPADPKSWEKV